MFFILFAGKGTIKAVVIVTRAFYMFEEPITFSDSNVFPADSLINYLDLFSSGRISIAKVFSERFSFTGGDSSGVDVGTYFAYNAHNTYVQSILEYGYIAGGAHILWLFACTVASVYRFITYPLIEKIPADRTSAKPKQKKLKKH